MYIKPISACMQADFGYRPTFDACFSTVLGSLGDGVAAPERIGRQPMEVEGGRPVLRITLLYASETIEGRFAPAAAQSVQCHGKFQAELHMVSARTCTLAHDLEDMRR